MVSAARVTRPVRKILLNLRESGAALDRDRNADALIVQSMGAILEKANRLDAVTQAAHDERQNRQIERLISGWSTDLQIEGIPQQSTLCYTLFQANNAQPNATLGPLLANYMRRLLPRDCIVQLLDAESLCILSACESETEREAFANQMERLFEMGTLFGAEIHGFISPLCLRPEEISCALPSQSWCYVQQDAAPGAHHSQERSHQSIAHHPRQTGMLHMLLAGKEDEACQFIQRSFLAGRMSAWNKFTMPCAWSFSWPCSKPFVSPEPVPFRPCARGKHRSTHPGRQPAMPGAQRRQAQPQRTVARPNSGLHRRAFFRCRALPRDAGQAITFPKNT